MRTAVLMMLTGKTNKISSYFFLKTETVQENTASATRTRPAESGDFWVGESGGLAVGESGDSGIDVIGTSALISGGTSVLSSA
jgi:hypothetical protein